MHCIENFNIAEIFKFKEKFNCKFSWYTFFYTFSECAAVHNDFKLCVKLSDEEIIKSITCKEPEKITDSE